MKASAAGIRTLRITALGAAALAVLAGCRQEMSEQPYYRPLEASEFYTAKPLPGSSARPPVEGTVPRGDLRDDTALFTGMQPADPTAGAQQAKLPVTEFPYTVTEDVIRRGHNRFEIYCSPCHGFTGDGQGMIVQRGLQGPANFHSDRLTTAPVGHYYDVITNGFGRMFAMPQIPVRDRWAIIAYVRALQLSQNARLEDVPEADRPRLLAMPATTTGTLAGPVPHDAPSSTSTTGGAH